MRPIALIAAIGGTLALSGCLGREAPELASGGRPDDAAYVARVSPDGTVTAGTPTDGEPPVTGAAPMGPAVGRAAVVRGEVTIERAGPDGAPE